MKKLAWSIEVKTKRLIIRPYAKRDFYQWVIGYNKRLPARDNFDPGPISNKLLSKSIFEKKVQKYNDLAKKDHLYVYGIFDRKTGENLGSIDILIINRSAFQWGNLGYQIHNQYWGKGYAKEAAKVAIKIAFKSLNLHRLEAATQINHKASIAVAKAIGMKKECTRLKFYREKNRWLDMVIFSCTSS